MLTGRLGQFRKNLKGSVTVCGSLCCRGLWWGRMWRRSQATEWYSRRRASTGARRSIRIGTQIAQVISLCPPTPSPILTLRVEPPGTITRVDKDGKMCDVKWDDRDRPCKFVLRFEKLTSVCCTCSAIFSNNLDDTFSPHVRSCVLEVV